jgi:hypothetical protein
VCPPPTTKRDLVRRSAEVVRREAELAARMLEGPKPGSNAGASEASEVSIGGGDRLAIHLGR